MRVASTSSLSLKVLKQAAEARNFIAMRLCESISESEQLYVSSAVADSEPIASGVPADFALCANRVIRGRDMHASRSLEVTEQVPKLHATETVHGGKKGRMRGTELHVVEIVCGTLEGAQRTVFAE